MTRACDTLHVIRYIPHHSLHSCDLFNLSSVQGWFSPKLVQELRMHVSLIGNM